jgi:spermidine synthase
VKRTERLDSAIAPDGTELTLLRHDGAYYIRARGIELMSTRRYHSEERLAELACEPLRTLSGARVLVGGLGLGFTLRAALRCLPDDAEVIVVELLEAVIRWNRNPEYDLAADALADPRVTVIQDDVAHVLTNSAGRFDAIMLDVDNGAEAFTADRNARLYRDAGLRAAAAALRSGGGLAYWSADPDPKFEEALRRVGLDVAVHPVRSRPGKGPKHFVYVARRR